MSKISKVLVIGSGPIVIGQAAEFGYAGTRVCKALRVQPGDYYETTEKEVQDITCWGSGGIHQL